MPNSFHQLTGWYGIVQSLITSYHTRHIVVLMTCVFDICQHDVS